MSVRLYTTDVLLRLWLGSDVKPLAQYVRLLQAALARSGHLELAPATENRAVVVAFDAFGRSRAWFVSDTGPAPEVDPHRALAFLEGLQPPQLRTGAIILALHYSFEGGDESLGMKWVPSPGEWRDGAQATSFADIDVHLVVQRILGTLPKRRTRVVHTPLSDAMSACLETGSDESYARFLDQFSSSEVGISIGGGKLESGQLQPTPTAPVMTGQVRLSDGRQMIMTFADPWEFAARFGLQFDGTVPGSDMMDVIRNDHSLDGLVVSSALVERSMMITRDFLS